MLAQKPPKNTLSLAEEGVLSCVKCLNWLEFVSLTPKADIPGGQV